MYTTIRPDSWDTSRKEGMACYSSRTMPSHWDQVSKILGGHFQKKLKYFPIGLQKYRIITFKNEFLSSRMCEER